MLEKLKGIAKEYSTKILSNTPSMGSTGEKIAYGLANLYILIIVAYLFGWGYNCFTEKKGDLQSLLKLLELLIGPSSIAAVYFIGRCFIDANNNGIADAFEGGDKHGSRGA